MNKKSTVRDMTTGSILVHMLAFSLPLIVGNLFQLLYNTVDTLVVGNYVSTQALAAVGSTTMITNIMVFFFNGLSMGAGVAISKSFGAGDMEKLHISIETTMALTFLTSVLFTVGGVIFVRPMLLFMSTPEDVMPDASLYLRIYFAGASGLMIYNMGSGILRAVGDTTRPLYFLMLTSIMNIILDLLFVLVFHAGIAGVAVATILSQFVSAFLVLYLLTRTGDIYRLTWNDLRMDPKVLREILDIGLPAAFQSMLTSFSNVFVQSYVNFFGSACMAGWSCYNKINQFAFLTIHSMANAASTFVSQNEGAGNRKRGDKGAVLATTLAILVTLVLCCFLLPFADIIIGFFTDDPAVITYGARFVRVNSLFICANCVNHVVAGALRGSGDAKGPMIIMIVCFVAVRQCYLFLATHLIGNTPTIVGLGYPVGWSACCITIIVYYLLRRKKMNACDKIS